MYSLNSSIEIKKYSTPKYKRSFNVARSSNDLHSKLMYPTINSKLPVVRLERLSNSIILKFNSYLNDNLTLQNICNNDYKSSISSSIEKIQFDEQALFENSDIDGQTKNPLKICNLKEFQTHIASKLPTLQLHCSLDPIVPQTKSMTDMTVQSCINNNPDSLTDVSLDVNGPNDLFLFRKSIINNQEKSLHNKICRSDNHVTSSPSLNKYQTESTTNLVNSNKSVSDKIDKNKQNLTYDCKRKNLDIENELSMDLCNDEQNQREQCPENMTEILPLNSKLDLSPNKSMTENLSISLISLEGNDNLNSFLNISNFDLIFEDELNDSVRTQIQQCDNNKTLSLNTENIDHQSITIVENDKHSELSNIIHELIVKNDENKVDNDSPATAIDYNHNFIEMQFIPTNNDDFVDMIHNEENIVNLEVEHNMSATLETILLSDFHGKPINLMQEFEEVTDKREFSPIELRKHVKLGGNKHVGENKIDNRSIHGVSELDFSSHSTTNHSIDDKTYNPYEQTSYETTNEEVVQTLPEITNNVGCVSKVETLLNIEQACKSGCEKSNLTVQPSSQPLCEKKHCCFYCQKKIAKLPRHLETVHRNEEDVKKFIHLPKGNKERQEIIAMIRDKGNFKYNTDPHFNKGDLIPSRRPNIKYNRKGDEYTACGKCLNFYTIGNIRHHTKKCTNGKTAGQREILVMGRAIEGRLHPNASDKLRLMVFPRLRENEVIKLIRYDWIIIIYGNKLCIKYTPHYQHNMIRARLRILGRLLYAIKSIDREVTDFASIYEPKFYDSVVKGIRIVAGFDKDDHGCRAPSIAENLVTYIKQVGQILISEYIKQENNIKQAKVENFLKIHVTDMPLSINKIAMETQARLQRQKKVILPSKQDVKTIITYINTERNNNYLKFLENYSLSDYKYGIELCALYLVVFNRRRVGEIQNILIDDQETRLL